VADVILARDDASKLRILNDNKHDLQRGHTLSCRTQPCVQAVAALLGNPGRMWISWQVGLGT
jgi:hypothetical protein